MSRNSRQQMLFNDKILLLFLLFIHGKIGRESNIIKFSLLIHFQFVKDVGLIKY